MERGVKFDESSHETEYGAHLELLHQLASSNPEYQAMSRTYKKLFREYDYLSKRGVSAKLGVGYIATNYPNFGIGDTVHVHIRSKDGTEKQLGIFKGTVVARKNSGAGRTFTVRGITDGVEAEKTFPLDSPVVASIDVVQKPKMHGKKQLPAVASGKVYRKKTKM